MNAPPTQVPSVEDHRRAFTEVSFLLDIFAKTVDELMGGATASVGRVAGRRMARKLPVHLTGPSLEQVVAAIGAAARIGAEMTFDPAKGELKFGRCAIREVCEQRGLALGGSLCHLFHFYLDGIVNDLYLRPVRTHVTATGPSCGARLEAR